MHEEKAKRYRKREAQLLEEDHHGVRREIPQGRERTTEKPRRSERRAEKQRGGRLSSRSKRSRWPFEAPDRKGKSSDSSARTKILIEGLFLQRERGSTTFPSPSTRHTSIAHPAEMDLQSCKGLKAIVGDRSQD